MLLPLILVAPLLAAEEPQVAVEWSCRKVRLEVLPPAGEHVAPEAPAAVVVAWPAEEQRWEGTGADLAPGVRVPRAKGEADLRVEVSLCGDDGAICRPFVGEARLDLAGRRGEATVALAPASAPAAHAPELSWEAAVAAAAADGRPIFLDFGARWCPPCNQLRVEVLEDPADRAVLDGFHVVAVDADLPESWPLKDRFGVGGYPTLLVVDAAGAVQGRLTGYPGEDVFLDWLQGAAAGPLDERLAGARTLDLVARGRLALDLLRADRAYEAWDVLMGGAEGGAAVEAGLALEGGPGEVRWLLEQRPDRVMAWFPDAGPALEADPSLVPALVAALEARVPRVPALEAAELLEILAELSPWEAARAHRQRAVDLLRADLTGDRWHDRLRWSALAWLLGALEDPAGSRAVLEAAAAAFPDEFTFHFDLAELHLEQGQADLAVDRARQALDHAEGDMLLRAATLLAEALDAAGRRAEARDLLQQVVDDFPRPRKDEEVRTWRYLAEARAVLRDLEGR